MAAATKRKRKYRPLLRERQRERDSVGVGQSERGVGGRNIQYNKGRVLEHFIIETIISKRT